MKKFLTFLLIINFSIIFVSPSIVYAGFVFVNNKNAVTILPGSASAKFQEELNKIEGLDAKNARLTFSEERGIEGSASPVNVDMLKIKDYDDEKYPFIGTTTGSMKIVGNAYARDGKIVFMRGSIQPATLSVFKIENAVENVLNSYIGANYIGSVDINNNQILARIVADPNPSLSSGSSSASNTSTTLKKWNGGIVPDCNKTGETSADPDLPTASKYTTACDFKMLGMLVNNVITFLLVYFATPLAAIIFAYAGFLLIFSGANEHNKGKAKSILGKVLVGYVVALAAWLIIHTILTSLGFPTSWSFL
ncbi:hypothetical protein IT400_02510 [Candidatus Nomurabacteria bacterium]|nr:hypothetical protein [Candidatus Nomurabacteria bacterium]